MPSNIKKMIDALATGKMTDANDAFKDEMDDRVSSAMADKHVEMASRMSKRPEDIEHPEQEDHYGEIEDASLEAGEIDLDEYDEE